MKEIGLVPSCMCMLVYADGDEDRCFLWAAVYLWCTVFMSSRNKNHLLVEERGYMLCIT